MNDDFDDMLRSRLQHSDPVGSSDPTRVLGELRPTMRRARIRRSVAVGAATLSFLGASGIGVAAVATSIGPQPSEVDVFDDGVQLPETPPPMSTIAAEDLEDAPDDLSIGEEGAVDASNTSLPAPTSTAPDEPTTTAASSTLAPPRTDPVTTPATLAPQQPPPVAAPTSITPPSTPPSTTPPTTQAPPTSTTTTPTTPAGQQTIQSNCGSISISYSGSSISLTGTQPAAGFVSDVKNAGPETVEVGYDNGSAECEIKAWMESGVLRTDVDNHDEDEDED